MRRQLLLAVIALVALLLAGYAISSVLEPHWMGQQIPGRGSAFFYMFGQYERPYLLLVLAFTVVAAGYLLAGRAPPATAGPPHSRSGRRPVLGLAAAVTLVCVLGGLGPLQGFPLSADEFNAQFQATIFASGRIAAPVPATWWELIHAIKPIFVTFRESDHTWLSSYLPVYAALRAPFTALGLDALMNPLLAGATVLVMFRLARQLWPDGSVPPWLPAILLATSSQFLLMSMSWYSMPAHLLFNLGWLTLYLGSPRARWLAPWVGALALGLHNPFPHALFVAPFLLRELQRRRLGFLGYALSVYAGASTGWLAWWGFALPQSTQAAIPSLFGAPDGPHLLSQVMSLALTASWQNTLLPIGFTVALIGWRSMDSIGKHLATGVLLTFLFYALYRDTQGHGWGYRYIHPALGSIVLVACPGLVRLGRAFGFARLRHLIIGTIGLAAVIQLPLRLQDAGAFVSPMAAAARSLRVMSPDVLVIPTDSIWYGFDLIRNDPYLERPVLISSESPSFTQAQYNRLRLDDPSLTVIPVEALEGYGLGSCRHHLTPCTTRSRD